MCSQTELTMLQKKYDDDAVFCKCCGESVFYKNTKYHTNKEKLLYDGGTTYRTKKTVNNKTYNLCVCENCMEKQFEDFVDKNKLRIYNTCNKYTEYAFDIPHDEIIKTNKSKAITLENCILKYGEEKGKDIFLSYCNKQSNKNTFESKHKKYGWTKEQFDSFNKSRAVTLDNLVKKYGEIEGKNKFEAYCNKQRKTKSKEYVIEKYGEEYWKNLCKEKGLTLNTFERVYGKQGKQKYEEYLNKRKKYTSNISIKYFNSLLENNSEIFNNLTIYYGNKNEFGFFDELTNNYYFIDFCIPELKIAIEFNGNYFHANPMYYNDNYSNFWHTKQTAKDIWKNDEIKYNAIENKGFKLFVVWEDDINNKKLENTIINEIKNRKNGIYS